MLRVLPRWATAALVVFGLVGPAGTAHAAAPAPQLTLSGPAALTTGEPGRVVVHLKAPEASGVRVMLGITVWDNVMWENTNFYYPDTDAGGEVSWPVDTGVAQYQRWSASVTIDGVKVSATTLSLVVNGRTSAMYSQAEGTALVRTPFTVRGRLNYAVGTSWPGVPVTVNVRRYGNDRERGTFTVTTESDGTFAFTDLFDDWVYPTYTLTWDGDATHDSVSNHIGVWLTRILLTPRVTVSPAAPAGDTPVTFSGSLVYDDPRSARLGRPVAVHVERHRAGDTGEPARLPDVTTTAEGAFSFTDRPGPGEWIYDLNADPDDERYGGGWGDLQLSVTRFGGTAVTVAGPAGVVWGSAGTYTGRVTRSDGAALSAPVPVTAVSRGACGTTRTVKATTDLTGAFRLAVAPACPVSATLTVTVAASADLGGSSATVTTPVKARPGAVAIKLYAKNGAELTGRIPAGTVKVAPVVTPSTSPCAVDLYVQWAGGRRTLVGRTSATGGSCGSRQVSFAGNGTLSAVFAGTDVTGPATASRAVKVAGKLTGTVSGHYRSSGGVYYFHRGQPFKVAAVLSPARAGDRIQVVVQRRVDGAWKAFRTVTVATSGGKAAATIKAATTAGEKYRVRVSWPGDARLDAVSTAWTTLSVTR
jgi:hypothetical protein